MISFACASCGHELEADDDLAGARSACPGCGESIAIPDILEDNAGSATLSPAEPTREELDFLDPPQTPNELGRLGNYRVLSILGAGGMGVVFRAEDLYLRRPVAIKAMLPEVAARGANRQRFLREAQATAAIEHEHIVTIYQVGEQRDVPYLVMQFLHGDSLADRLAREGRLPLPEALRIARQTAVALAVAHERGLIHRDVKPANIFLEGVGSGERGTGKDNSPDFPSLLPTPHSPLPSSPRVKLLDFGLARSTAADTQLTQTGIILGTPAYMSPEQARGKVVDHLSDLFSLGCVLYQACTGTLPFKGKDTMARLVSLVLDEAPPLWEFVPDAPPALCELVEMLMAKSPADRPASARAVVELIASVEERLARSVSAVHDVAAEPVLDSQPFRLQDEVNEPSDPGSDVFDPPPTSTARQADAEPAVERLEDLAGRTLGRFDVGPVLGRGAHGVVFRALDRKHNQPVALKILSPEFPRDRDEKHHFLDAMKAVLPRQHPNLVNLHGVGRTGPYCWIARELIDGKSVAQLAKSGESRPDWRLALRLAIDGAHALDFIGRQHLSHGNVTPANLLAAGAEGFKLSDLMLSRALADSLLARQVAPAKRIAEFPYVAPELLDGGVADELSDLYSLGAVAYTLLVGRPPYEGTSADELLHRIRTAEPARPRKFQRGMPKRFEWVVLTLLAEDRQYRIQSPAELLVYLEQIEPER